MDRAAAPGFSYVQLNYGSPLKAGSTSSTPVRVVSSEEGIGGSGETSLSSFNGGGIPTYVESFTPSVFSSPAHIATYTQQQPPLQGFAHPSTPVGPPSSGGLPFSPYAVTPFPAVAPSSATATPPRSQVQQLPQQTSAPPRTLSFGDTVNVAAAAAAASQPLASTVIDTAAFASSPTSSGSTPVRPGLQQSRSYSADLVQPVQPVQPVLTPSPVLSTHAASSSSSGLGSIEHCSPDPQHPSYVPPVRSVVNLAAKRVPNRQEAAKKAGLPLGMLICPLAPVGGGTGVAADKPPPPCLRRPPVVCHTCGGVINKYCPRDFTEGRGQWTCVLCDATNTHPDEYGDASCAQFPEFTRKTVEYLDPSLQVYPGPNTPEPAYFFLLDASFVQSDIEIVRVGILNAVKTLPETSRVGLITFASAVSVYELGLSDVASAEVFPGENSLSNAEFEGLVARQSNFVASLGTAAGTIDRILTALVASAPQKRQLVQSRAVGTALEIALSLVTGETKDAWKDVVTEGNERARMDARVFTGGQLFVFMTGAANFGPGGIPDDVEETMQKKNYFKEQATAYYRQLGLDAHKMNVMVDVFCCGLKNFYVKILQNLVLSNGGAVIAQRDLHDSTFFPTLLLAAHRCTGRDGTFDIQCTAPVVFTHIIGPAIAGTSKWEGRHHFRMGSVQPRTCYSLYCALGDDVPADHVYFQFVVRYTNRDHQCITRVVTQRLATTGSVPNYLASVDPDVMSTLLAKKIVLLSRKLDKVDDVLDHLDKTIMNVVAACGTKDKDQRSPNYVLPDTIAPIPKNMYLLRRGPMLAPILQHPDDIDYVRCLFLNSNLEDSLRLINPPLYLARGDQELERIPPEDLALQSRFVLLLDHHTDLFIWVGRQAAAGPDGAQQIERCRRAAASFAAQRFPQPQLMVFQEGASMARCLQVRLIPSHKDSWDEQRRSFPLVAELGEKEHAAFVARFHRTDEPSFQHHFRSLVARLK